VALDEYIQNLENGKEWEYRRVLGIYGNISKSQKEYIRKWSEDFGYSTEILAEAYDIAMLNTGKGDLRYIDSVLSGWHEAGCKTVGECRAHSETKRAERTAKSTEKKYTKSKPEAPRYGEFDINEAFEKALERSYGRKDD
jgi:DnaD/phage-associated family protein